MGLRIWVRASLVYSKGFQGPNFRRIGRHASMGASRANLFHHFHTTNVEQLAGPTFPKFPRFLQNQVVHNGSYFGNNLQGQLFQRIPYLCREPIVFSGDGLEIVEF